MSATLCIHVLPRLWLCEQNSVEVMRGVIPVFLILGAARLPALSCSLMLSLLRDASMSGGGRNPPELLL